MEAEVLPVGNNVAATPSPLWRGLLLCQGVGGARCSRIYRSGEILCLLGSRRGADGGCSLWGFCSPALSASLRRLLQRWCGVGETVCRRSCRARSFASAAGGGVDELRGSLVAVGVLEVWFGVLLLFLGGGRQEAGPKAVEHGAMPRLYRIISNRILLWQVATAALKAHGGDGAPSGFFSASGGFLLRRRSLARRHGGGGGSVLPVASSCFFSVLEFLERLVGQLSRLCVCRCTCMCTSLCTALI